MEVGPCALLIKFVPNRFPHPEPAVRRSRRGRQDNIKDRAQLRLFGNARPLVELLAERIRVRAVTENAYADITYVLPVPDHDDDQAPATTLFMVMIAEEWANVNRELRKERAPLELLAEHVTYVSNADDHFKH